MAGTFLQRIKVIDLFAGPGGLGEGFARFSPDGSMANRPFEIVFSAEKDPMAIRTLRLRKFFRLCEELSEVPESYFRYVRGESDQPYDRSTEALWKRAGAEACPVALGTADGDRLLEKALKRHILPGDDWILIGGPPCQAYSLVGRARNRGVEGYDATNDERHFLYEHYLRVLAKRQPAAFVMENVKGLLSSRVGSEQIFPKILRDLTEPARHLGKKHGPRYTIHALAAPMSFSAGQEFSEIDPRAYILRAEEYGIPQARHRVILLGTRDDLGVSDPSVLKPVLQPLPARYALQSLPPLRSGLTGEKVDTMEWRARILCMLSRSRRTGLDADLADEMEYRFKSSPRRQKHLDQGGRFIPRSTHPVGRSRAEQDFLSLISNDRIGGVLNHEARAHMPEDLLRYLFVATNGAAQGRSPTAAEFPDALAPAHKNWRSGKFADRFRVQLHDRPSTTVTSHISKDGHYFIHPEAWQCRSLTVREAARLQTFPDDYFFEGSRTGQFVQVGNAVPPLLALGVAERLFELIVGKGKS
jgi:DNA (cytosine-5)-methyltransferase 1